MGMHCAIAGSSQQNIIRFSGTYSSAKFVNEQWHCTKNMFSIKQMWPNLQETADLVTFIGEILNGKLHFFVQCDVKLCDSEVLSELC